MKACDSWFHEIGSALADGGNPFTQATKSIASDGAVSDKAPAASGYSILEADSLDAAVGLGRARHTSSPIQLLDRGRGGRPFGPQARADPLGLAQHAEDVATGDHAEVLVRVAAIAQLLEERRVARDVLEPVRNRLHAVEIAPDT